MFGAASGKEKLNKMALSLMVFPVVPGGAELGFENSFSYPRGEHTHDAIDIIGPRGLSIVSTTMGRVVNRCKLGGENHPGAGNSPRGGNYVVVADIQGNFRYYAHMQAPPRVAPGAWVGPGTILGSLGDTGIARGRPHLHYQVWGPFTDEGSRSEYLQNEFPRRFRNPLNPYLELARLATAMRATRNAGGRYTIPAARV